MENTTKEAEHIKDYLLNESAYHAQMALKCSDNEEKQNEHLKNSDENYGLMSWFESLLTQFEQMKTALENIANYDHNSYFEHSFFHCKNIANKALASLTETNEKP